MPWCIASTTDGQRYPGEIEHVQDSLVQACAVVSIGVSAMGNKKALLWIVSLDLKHTEAGFRRFRLIRCAYKSLRGLDLEIW
jgi:hypothetical protein